MTAVPSGYRHSKAFATLKATNETISTNLTTPQYLRTLDDLLLNAFKPILLNTQYADGAVASIAGWQEMNFRRKVSFLDRPTFYSKCFRFFAATGQDKVVRFKDLKIERGLRFQVLKRFLNATSAYVKALSDTEVPLDTALAVKAQYEAAFESTDLLSVCREVAFWLERAEEFKRQISEKFVRLTLNTAKNDYVSFFECRGVSLDDMVQVYLLAASRAIDKCDADQGALTSHIMKWFLTARLRVSQQRDSASTQERLDNLSVQDLDPTLSLDEEVQDPLVVRYLAKIADPLGAARIALGIEEHLNQAELSLLGHT
jgi:hypothetical protein